MTNGHNETNLLSGILTTQNILDSIATEFKKMVVKNDASADRSLKMRDVLSEKLRIVFFDKNIFQIAFKKNTLTFCIIRIKEFLGNKYPDGLNYNCLQETVTDHPSRGMSFSKIAFRKPVGKILFVNQSGRALKKIHLQPDLIHLINFDENIIKYLIDRKNDVEKINIDFIKKHFINFYDSVLNYVNLFGNPDDNIWDLIKPLSSRVASNLKKGIPMYFDYFVQGIYDDSVSCVFTYSFDDPLDSDEILYLQIISNVFATRFHFIGG